MGVKHNYAIALLSFTILYPNHAVYPAKEQSAQHLNKILAVLYYNTARILFMIKWYFVSVSMQLL